MSDDGYKLLRSLKNHEEGTATLVVAGLCMGLIPACTCPMHSLEQDLHAEAIDRRN